MMEEFLDRIVQILRKIPKDDALHECGGPCVSQLASDPTRALATANTKLRNTFPFKDVPTCWRRLYTDASISLAVQTTRKAVTQEQLSEKRQAWLTDVVCYLDMALIMTGGCGREDMIAEFFQQLEYLISPNGSASCSEPARKRRKFAGGSTKPIIPLSFPEDSTRAPSIRFPVLRRSMTMTSFQNYLDSADPGPLIIPGLIEHWPARHERPWASPEYLSRRTLGGRRLVPIELGRSYTDDGWGQKIVRFEQFLDTYILRKQPKTDEATSAADSSKLEKEETPEEQPIAYLAQHDLFRQMPQLRADISIPDLCYTDPPRPRPDTMGNTKSLSSSLEKLETPLLNAWFGPQGTISPLHTDPYHNILSQVVGKKYVRLYAPQQTEKMFPRGVEDGVDMSNTSSIPVEVVEMGPLAAEDDTDGRWDKFGQAPYVETILAAGECLYIPTGWWHYVRSLSVSFSVSFWWN